MYARFRSITAHHLSSYLLFTFCLQTSTRLPISIFGHRACAETIFARDKASASSRQQRRRCDVSEAHVGSYWSILVSINQSIGTSICFNHTHSPPPQGSFFGLSSDDCDEGLGVANPQLARLVLDYLLRRQVFFKRSTPALCSTSCVSDFLLNH